MEHINMESFSKQLRMAKDKGFDVYLTVADNLLTMEVTDGDYDRTWRLDLKNTAKLLSLADGINKIIDVFPKNYAPANDYIKAFENLCAKHAVNYTYNSWMGSDCHFSD
jgi:hypothetical protein